MAWPAPVCGIVWPSTLELGAGLASPGLAEGEGDADALELGTAEPSGLLLDVEEGDAEGPVDELDEGDGDGVCADADDPSMISEPIIKHATEATASARDSASFRIGSPFLLLRVAPETGSYALNVQISVGDRWKRKPTTAVSRTLATSSKRAFFSASSGRADNPAPRTRRARRRERRTRAR